MTIIKKHYKSLTFSYLFKKKMKEKLRETHLQHHMHTVCDMSTRKKGIKKKKNSNQLTKFYMFQQKLN